MIIHMIHTFELFKSSTVSTKPTREVSVRVRQSCRTSRTTTFYHLSHELPLFCNLSAHDKLEYCKYELERTSKKLENCISEFIFMFLCLSRTDRDFFRSYASAKCFNETNAMMCCQALHMAPVEEEAVAEDCHLQEVVVHTTDPEDQ